MWKLLVSDELTTALYIVIFCYVKALCDGSLKLNTCPTIIKHTANRQNRV